jgi:beta-lactamase class A
MKVPVMIEAFKLVADGKISLTDSILIKNEFKSIVDNGPYRLKTKDDSEFDLYKIVGQKRPLSELIYKMITASSNLATNILIEQVGADQTTQTMRELGAMDILVLRGVEDSLAHAHKLDNTVTAYDLMLIFEKMANGEVVSQEASRAMIAILLDQKFNTIIPARLPTGARVAHKTGWFKGLHHDAGIVFLADGKKYVLVILSRGLEDEDSAVKAMARVSATLYKYVNHSHAKWP